MFSKVTKLTKVEAYSLVIAQWCIMDLLPEQFKGRNVFFTQVTVSTVHPKKLKNDFAMPDGREYKAITLKAYFTTIDENSGNDAHGEIPFIEGELVFRNEGIAWNAFAFRLMVSKYHDIYEYPFAYYHALIPYNEGQYAQYAPIRERQERFKAFSESYVLKAFLK